MLRVITSSMLKLMQDFYTLTRLRIVLFDSNNCEILSYPDKPCDFCNLIRSIPNYTEQCHKSDNIAFNTCRESNNLFVYKCHAGLFEAVVPIEENGYIIGYVMFGQILSKNTYIEDRVKMAGKYSEKSFPGISRAINSIVTKSPEQINAAGTILKVLTQFIASNRWVFPDKSEFFLQLDNYIDNNISSAITIESLCSYFSVGRTKLYDISSKYLETNLIKYIQTRRIEHAKRLLRETSDFIADIAYTVGFNDYNYFSRVFRSISGMSAREYRKSH